MDLSKLKKVHMIGVKGVGMTMLAQFLTGKGVQVQGSDIAEKFMTDQVLAKAGVRVIEGFDPANIPTDANIIIYSTSYNTTTNTELAAAFQSNTKCMPYAEALADIFNQHFGIAVTGSHGKTTTTAWLGYVIDRAGMSPSVLVGARVPQFDGASLIGKSDYMIVEADEYQNKLRYFNPRAALMNNIDWDHPDFFPTEESYRQAFIDFVKKVPSKGFLVVNFDDAQIRKYVAVNCRGRVISYALNETADYTAYDIRFLNGRQYFKVRMRNMDEEMFADPKLNRDYQGELAELGEFSIGLAGRHNISNALAVLATAIELGIELVSIRQYLGEFTGTARRLERMGTYKSVQVYDDYAHHPSEIKATLAALRQLYPKERLVTVFHPHTYSRTKELLSQFAESFVLTDELIVLDIYGSAREAQGGVHSKDLVAKIESLRANGFAPGKVQYIGSQADCEAYLRANLARKDVLLLVGAGDVFRIGERLIDA
jgi:UDP-N-acetylmuramate--alanine ligase